MTKAIKNFLLASLFIVFIGCKEDKVEPTTVLDTTVSTIYLIRHAEKDRNNPDDADPELNQAGLGRAMKWADVFDEIPLDAIYTTEYERTTMTATPTEVQQNITAQYYNPSELDIDAFKAESHGKNVLVVGHSNTTPTMVNELIGEEKYETLDEYDNGSLFIVRFIGDKPTVIRLNIDLN